MTTLPYAINVHTHTGGMLGSLRFASRGTAEAQAAAYEKAIDEATNFRGNERPGSVRLHGDDGIEVIVQLAQSGGIELIEIAVVDAANLERIEREAELVLRFPHLRRDGGAA